MSAGSGGDITGLFRELVDTALAERLAALDTERLRAAIEAVDVGELPERVGDLAAEWVAQALDSVPDEDRAAVAHALVARLADTINAELDEPALAATDMLVPPIRELTAIEPLNPAGNVIPIRRPLTPVGDTVLLTNARGEPALIAEIEAEIASAERIDLVLAFIRWTGIRKLIEPLTRHVAAGKALRIITTTYTGSTETTALDKLRDLGAQIKVSYDTSTTRLHAKAWMFTRPRGLSTVYIGSSNLTHSAQVSGMEWNVRASEHRNPDVVRSFESTFESYWADPHFEDYVPADFAEAVRRTSGRDDSIDITPFDIKPYPFQRQILEQLEVERRRGRPHSLVVAATGTGKTVVAALDYRNLRATLGSSRLLFIAHRKEILDQSRTTFRHVLRDGGFGERWVDGDVPERWDHVFASIQSLSASGLDRIERDHFDVVIVDEFHHAAAPTYEEVLDRLRPKHLVGLTATPERTDGLDVTKWFGGRIAVELRLWDALEQQLLAPFHYFGVADGTDLSRLGWSGGRYNIAELTNVYTADDFRVGKVLEQLREIVGDVGGMKALGFCVSVDHAEFMAGKFRRAGIAARTVSHLTSSADRRSFLQELRDGKLQILFTVDLFNEGVDVPTVDTVLMLRPTESATIFPQQLGRGLRKHDGKTVLTVLDFVGQQRKEFRFDQRFSRLLGRTRRQVATDIEGGFPFLPAGCEINLDAVTREVVLENVRQAVPATIGRRVEELRSLGDVPLGTFLHEAVVDLPDIYAQRHYWTSTRRAAGFVAEAGPDGEDAIGRGIGRMLHIDDLERIDFLRGLLGAGEVPAVATMSAADRARVRMALLTLLAPRGGQYADLQAAVAHLWGYGEVRRELVELLDVLADRVTHLHEPVDISPDVPLQVHATCAREEILAAFDVSRVEKPVKPQSGVFWHEPTQTDLFFVTLDKSDREFSPTTRYRDYAINDTLFHWESQSVTREASDTGQRYIHQRERGTNVALFIRRSKQTPDRRTRPYFFAGLADYVSHRGEKPIALTWQLRHPLPGDTFADFRAAVA